MLKTLGWTLIEIIRHIIRYWEISDYVEGGLEDGQNTEADDI